MEKTKKYLDYEGLKTYHNELVKRIKDLEYDPERIFRDTTELCSRSKWSDESGRIVGLKSGLIVTVGGKLWQLVDVETFSSILKTLNPYFNPATAPADDLGWVVVGVDFDVDNHILQLKK